MYVEFIDTLLSLQIADDGVELRLYRGNAKCTEPSRRTVDIPLRATTTMNTHQCSELLKATGARWFPRLAPAPDTVWRERVLTPGTTRRSAPQCPGTSFDQLTPAVRACESCPVGAYPLRRRRHVALLIFTDVLNRRRHRLTAMRCEAGSGVHMPGDGQHVCMNEARYI
ncbi:hypothetical protein BD309DRAFT_418193 [Dichomitus squalens]|nr:hypothetical protein BD309DRAFT_418193 [Dichomitus squalens]